MKLSHYLQKRLVYVIILINLTSWPLSALLKDELLNNALLVLDRGHEVKYQFIKDVFIAASVRKEIVNPAVMLEKIAIFEQTCPYFLLDECSEVQHCYLSRGFDASFRNSFENKISQSLIQSIRSNPTQSTHYLVFGSGYLFTDLVVLTKTLQEEPTANLTINLVDTEYQPCLAATPSAMQFDEAVITYYVPILRAIFKQFTNCLQSMFPEAILTVHFYGDHETFINAATSGKATYPDVFAAADLPSSHRILLEYQTLIRTILERKPKAKNYFLNAANCLPFNSNKENGKIGAYAVIKSYTINQDNILQEEQITIPSSNKFVTYDNKENSAIINFIVRGNR